ncbi:unnamed protein product [Allacma fusca]|uniref:CRAL-TRIO domain-containing protein n=1 Tax=Allacma fusca TaxID=39272 RepID=A0A8J2PPT2_9HEXA|nr:unnamed protein product [Allacma fusca]
MALAINGRAPTKEEIAIKEVRAKLTDVILADKTFDDDYYLLQWLKAQNLNPDKAETMIRNSIKWRADEGIHTNIAAEFSNEILEQFPIPFSKTKDGVPIGFVHMGKMNFKKGVTTLGRTGWNKYWAISYAQAEELMIAYNKTYSKDNGEINSNSTRGIVGFVDAKNVSSLQLLNLDVIRRGVDSTRTLMNVFPAMFNFIIFFNMSTSFKVLFNAIKPFLTGPALTVEINGTDEKVWRGRLLEIVNLEVLNELESHWKSPK